MDRRDMEPRNRLLQDQSRLQALLRRKNGQPPQGHGPGELQKWLWADASAANAGAAVALENPEASLRQLHERPLSCGRAALLYKGCVRRDAESPLASISGAHKE